jgi:hypothetical protein
MVNGYVTHVIKISHEYTTLGEDGLLKAQLWETWFWCPEISSKIPIIKKKKTTPQKLNVQRAGFASLASINKNSSQWETPFNFIQEHIIVKP